MQQNYQDAMAIVCKYGKPDLFLTFTCNPKLPEIIDNLKPHQHAQDRPDLVARVFKKHLDELMTDIRDKHVLGIPVAYIHVIEFQKRGLPHAHMLIVLQEACKLRGPLDIDSLICAEIPDKETHPELHNIIQSCMIHGPCGTLNPKAPCMEDGKCTKDFPKAFSEATVITHDGYPHYRRRDDGNTVTVGRHDIDNRWIVPHNPYLSKKFQAHINLEACMSIKSVKYLFKYVYKGHDCANIEVVQEQQLDHDEIRHYIDTRYVSPPEAFWRLSEYRLHSQSHVIVRLPVHLPDCNLVYFSPDEEEAALQREASNVSQLSAWFTLNSTDASACQWLYPEVPSKYTYDRAKKKWKQRKIGGQRVIARMYAVNPADKELSCLRILLLHVPGANSYEDLKTVNAVTHNTFYEACIALNLLADDKQWISTMEEAVVFRMPLQLRFLFATLCSHCQLKSPAELWERFKDDMSEDYCRRYAAEDALLMALRDIQEILSQSGIWCENIGLPKPPDVVQFFDDIDVITESQMATENLNKLNKEQHQLVDAVLSALTYVESGSPPKSHALFLDGPGGSGKTMVYNTLISLLRSKNKQVAACAWTGIAATLLHSGQTVHSLFKLPVPILDTSTCAIQPTSKQAEKLTSLSLIIIDEASMVPLHALRAIDVCLRDITSIDVPFGGRIVLMGGDWRLQTSLTCCTTWYTYSYC